MSIGKRRREEIKRSRKERKRAWRAQSYNMRTFGCEVLDPNWKFSTSHRPQDRTTETHCIYGIADARDHVIRYVGYTSKEPQKRLAEHVARPVGKYMADWLAEIKASWGEPEIAVIEWCNDWSERERLWIARMRKVGSLLNVTDGGRYGRKKQNGSRVKCVGGPVKVFTKEEIDSMNATMGPRQISEHRGEKIISPARFVDGSGRPNDGWRKLP